MRYMFPKLESFFVFTLLTTYFSRGGDYNCIKEKKVQTVNVIYADIYFLVNFSMDALALFVCAKIRKLPLKILRLTFAAAVGSAYAVARLFMNGSILPLVLSVLVPFLICYISFEYGRLSAFLLNVVSFWLISWLLGGALTAVYYLTDKILASQKIYINGRAETLYSDIPFSFILICALSCAFLTLIWNRIAEKKLQKTNATVQIDDGDISIIESALCDSGDLLTEPLSGTPVIIISPVLMEKIIPGGVDSLIKSGAAYAKKLRVIPYSTVSESGILYGYIPDRVLVNGAEKRACLCSAAKLCEKFGEHRIIIPTSLL